MKGLYSGTIFRCCLLISMSQVILADSNEGPDRLTATIGEVLIRIDGPKLWTLSGIEYQKTVTAVEESAYGTAMNLTGVGFLGSAHFLDDPSRPGGVEKENVTQVQFALDDRHITEIRPVMNVVGQSFQMERRSKIRSIDLQSTLSLRDGVLAESVRLRTVNAVDLKVVYPLMYAWTPNATSYLFGNGDGIRNRGQFLDAPAKPMEGNERLSEWMAIYDKRSCKGAVCYLVQRPTTAEVSLQFTDAPGVYRKLRLMCFCDQTMPAGFDGTIATLIGFFTATESDWEATALKRASELKSLPKSPDREG